jgi:predicted dehydrogenase
MSRKRYVQVGLGGRSEMFTKAITESHKDHAELVGLCDLNLGRAGLCHDKLVDGGYGDVPVYHSDDFDKMIAEQKPDVVIVTTKDCFHDEYICRAMELGCDAITEKPMTTDAGKCQRIVDTVAKTGKDLRVTFNYRYSPGRSKIKELLMDGTIGKLLSVDFTWNLDTRHGADYYRRWHRNKVNSGGLMVHKATHHFDLINWWISSSPDTVTALGRRAFYIPATADKLGLTQRTERCQTCPHMADESCKFALDLSAKDGHRTLYLEQEHHDGYFRDRCVFSDDIDIEDSMNVAVRYESGVHMSYCLNSFLPWEGYRIAFNGDRGRLETQVRESVYVSGDGSTPGEQMLEESYIRVFPHFAEPYAVEIPKAVGGHGGGDTPLLDDIFSPDPPADSLKRAAGLPEGCWSILTGVAANISMKSDGGSVHVPDLVTGIPDAHWTEMKE